MEEEGEEVVTTKQKPMGSANELLSIIPLPDAEATTLLKRVINGEISFAAAKGDCDTVLASAKAIRAFEEVFNKKNGVTNVSRSRAQYREGKGGKWVSDDDICKTCPGVPTAMLGWRTNFEGKKSKLSGKERLDFDRFVETFLTGYKKSQRTGGKPVPTSVPVQLNFYLSKEAKGRRRRRLGRGMLFKVWVAMTHGLC